MSIIELRGVHFCPKTLNSTTEREALSGPFAGSNLTKSTSWLVFWNKYTYFNNPK